MKIGGVVRALLFVAGLVGEIHAAKVFLFLSPFGKTTVCLTGASYGYNACSDSSASKLHLNPKSWMEFDFTTVPTSGIGINQGNWAWQSSEFRVDSLFATHDTIWAIPDPYPAGKTLKLLVSPPKTRTIMLWNPWEDAATAPWMQNAGGAWGKMSSNATLPGWYTSMIVGYNTLSLLFSDSSRTRYFGAAGTSTAAGAPFVVDSIGNVSDTIWIRGTPEIAPTKAIATAKQPKDKVVMLFNPWSGIYPIQHPRITIGGKGPLPTHADANHCGWYSFSHFDRSPQVTWTNDRTGATFGKAGIGSTATIDLSTITGDTSWVHLSGGQVVVGGTAPLLRGPCEVSYLAATIRDFPSDRSNIEFAWGSGCERSGWGVVKGMVDTILGPDRKPVRSPHDTGSLVREDWWERFSYRCTYDTVKPATKALIGDTGIATSWFRTVPGKNAETCRDIPLKLDSTGTYYVYDNQNYFPIDDFSRLPDGSANPYYDQIPGNDGKPHNYSFCLESHGDFEYRKGQVFRFTGDDDVWFFIDNKLVVDLGGIHGAASDSVFLDSLGLVEDATYPFDFFFCERDPLGSDMMIRTTMNLRTNSSFRVTDSIRQAGKHDYDAFVSTTSGQGCRSVASVVRTSTLIRLLGPSFPTPKKLSNGTWYGGIEVDSSFGRVTVDSASITGLVAGTYTIVFRAEYDTTVARQYTFVVPFSVSPAFVNEHPVTGPIGTSFAVEVGTRNENGVDSSSSSFHIRASGGVALFADSTLLRPITPADTLRTGIDGIPRRLWAVTTKAGTWSLSIGSGSADTADIWAGIVVLPYQIAFVDSVGRKLPGPVPVSLSPGQGTRIRIGLFVGDSLCRSCAEPIALTPSSPTLTISATSGGAAIATGTTTGGLLDVWVKGSVGVDSASVTAILVSDTSVKAVWKPITVLGWRLRFVDAAGKPLAPQAVVLSPGKDFQMRLGLFLGDSLCTSCVEAVSLATSSPVLTVSATAGGAAVSSGTTTAGVLGVWVRGSTGIDSASLTGTLVSDPSIQAVWKPITIVGWRLRFVDSLGRILTTTPPVELDPGEGLLVRVGLFFGDSLCTTCTDRIDLAASNPLVVSTLQNGAAAASTTLSGGVASLWVRGASPIDSAGATASLGSTPGVSATWMPISVKMWRLRFLRGTTASDTMGAIDQEVGTTAPVTVQVWGRLGPCDVCTGSIALSTNSKGLAFETSVGATATSVAIAAGTATFLVRGKTPVHGDTITMVSDLGSRLSGHPVIFRVPAPDSARMFDRDGDGRADSMLVHLHRPGSSTNAFRASWPDSSPLVAGLVATFLDSTRVGVAFAQPFAENATSANSARGAYSWDGLGGWVGFPLRDGIAPVPLRAWIRWGDGATTPDTLRVTASERVVADGLQSLVRLGTGAGMADQASARRLTISGDTLVLLWNPSSIATCPRPGDSLGFLSTISDVLGNAPGSHGRKVAIEGRGRPPLSATYLDVDGDGRIDAVRLKLPTADPAGALQRYDLSLPGPGGVATRLDLPAERIAGDSLALRIVLTEPFPFGWTSFPVGNWVLEQGGSAIPTFDGVGPVIDTAFIRRTELDDGHDSLLVVPSEPLDGTPGSSWVSVFSIPTRSETSLPPQSPAWKGDTLVFVLFDDSSAQVRIGDSVRWTDLVADSFANPGSGKWRPVGGAPRPLFLRIIKPRGLFVPDPSVRKSENSLQVQVDASGRWTGWDLLGASPSSGANSACDTIVCSGPTIEINERVDVSLHIYDHMGVFVTSLQAHLDPSTLPTDDRDRVRVRILWNGHAAQGGEAARGVYLMRMILRARSDAGESRIFNTIWKIGVVPERN